MKRVELWWVNFGPSIGGEVQMERPALAAGILPAAAPVVVVWMSKTRTAGDGLLGA